MYIRSIFRLIEFSDGWFGTIASHESCFYCFDFLMIFLCFVVFTVFHFGVHLRKAELALPVTMPQEQTTQDAHSEPVVPAGKESDTQNNPLQIKASAV